MHKNILFLVMICLSSFAYSQINPNFKLRNPQQTKIDVTTTKPGDLIVVLGNYEGWSDKDYIDYYIFGNDDEYNVKAYRKEFIKDYLVKNGDNEEKITEIPLTDSKKLELRKKLKAKELKNLLKLNQSDFKKPLKRERNSPPPCAIADSGEYVFTIIQNKKEQKYSYYAPTFYYEDCDDKTINKPALKKYIDVIRIWWWDNK